MSETEEKRTTVRVRLVQGFGASTGASTHRRGPVVLTQGPDYQEFELTKDELDAVKADPAFEVESKSRKAAAKDEGEVEDTTTSPKKTSTKNTAPKKSTGKKGDEVETPPAGGDKEPKSGPKTRRYEGDVEDEDLSKLSIEELRVRAEAVGVQDADKLETVDAAVEAIKAKQSVEE